MNKFWRAMQVKNSYKLTQNGAITHKSTLNDNLDLFATSLRFLDEKDLKRLFIKAYNENETLALANLLNILDIREGKGERKAFKVMINELAKLRSQKKFDLDFIYKMGRWDYVLELYNNPNWKNDVVDLINKTLIKDTISLKKDEPVSLLAKWLPSINTSSATKRNLARKLAKEMNMKPEEYRKTLAKLRNHLKVVEVFMCKKEFGKINYEEVPSKAMLRYRNAFATKDEDRFNKYLKLVENNKIKINTSVLNPDEIIAKYGYRPDKIDKTLEALWNNLKDYTSGSNTLVMADTSDSMRGKPMDVSLGLAIYFAQLNKSVWKNKFLTFSESPTLVELKGKTLYSNLNQIEVIVENTDINKAFKLVLSTAVKNKLKQKDMPNEIIVISDMEFDEAEEEKTNFKLWKNNFENEGYTLPKIIFWNISQYQDQSFPVVKDEPHCALISGFSPAVLKNLFDLDKISPEVFMIETLDKYASLVEEIFQ